MSPEKEAERLAVLVAEVRVATPGAEDDRRSPALLDRHPAGGLGSLSSRATSFRLSPVITEIRAWVGDLPSSPNSSRATPTAARRMSSFIAAQAIPFRRSTRIRGLRIWLVAARRASSVVSRIGGRSSVRKQSRSSPSLWGIIFPQIERRCFKTNPKPRSRVRQGGSSGAFDAREPGGSADRVAQDSQR